MPGVLLFGGSFDPIHHGHLIACRAAAEQLGVTRVVLLPSGQPPHKRGGELSPAAVRVELCRRAVAGDDLFELDDWETRQDGPSYTLHSVRRYRDQLGTPEPLYFLMGLDALADLGSWHRARDLASQCVIVTVRRAGTAAPDLARLSPPLGPEQLATIRAHILDTPTIEISATEIRARVRKGWSIRYLVPAAVEALIHEHGLYR
ncbi:MAG: nicotinate (nicotinamide) nucleotide adenylyltransferase [Phycisphaerae bacterium]